MTGDEGAAEYGGRPVTNPLRFCKQLFAYVEQRFGTIAPARGITDVLLDGVRMWWLIALALHSRRSVSKAPPAPG